MNIKHLLLLFMLNALAVHSQKNLVVGGTIEGLESGRLFLLVQTGENRVDTLGSCLFETPDFVLEGKLTEPAVARIVVENFEGGFTFLAEPETEYEALLRNGAGAYIRGGVLQREWLLHTERVNSMQLRLKNLREKHEELRKQNKFRSASAMNDSVMFCEEQIRQQNADFLTRNDNLISAYTAQMNALSKDAGFDESMGIYRALGPGAKNTLSARIMKERIDRLEMTSMGQPAPDFTLQNTDGQDITLSRIPAKIKIVDFWASWCGPCRLNNPALKELYDEYRPKGLEIVGISLDDNKGRWTDAIAKDGLPWIQISSLAGFNCPVAKMYSVTAIPAIFVLDENNKIIATNLREEKLKAFIEEKLK